MSEENVEVVRAIYEGWAAGDYEAVFARLDTDIEWFGPPDISAAGEPGSGLSRGHEGVRRSLARWVGAWDDYSFELRGLIDFGDHVLVEGRHGGRGKASGAKVSEEIFSVWTLRAGQAVRQRMFRDRAQALEAARRE
jgi:ketosteroid isomerase-like protein